MQIKNKVVAIDLVIPVYNPEDNFIQILAAMAAQKIDTGVILEIILVNDGGKLPDVRGILNQFNNIYIVSLLKNQGRAAARNAGARFGKGEYILFIDADCEPIGNELINGHIKVFGKGFDVSFGSVKARAKKGDFWSDYFSVVEFKRNESALNGNFLALTSAHFAIKRSVFEQCGGFDESYRYYGFEDRDFIASVMQTRAKISYLSHLAVRHEVDLRLTDICRKMEESGQHTAPIFAEKYPDIYANMLFSRFDIRKHPFLLAVPMLFSLIIFPWLIKPADRALNFIPKKLAYFFVKIFTGMAFLKGTARTFGRKLLSWNYLLFKE